MENLLCDEVWLSSSETKSKCSDIEPCISVIGSFHEYDDEQEFEQALNVCLEKEIAYMPAPNYVEYLQSNNLILARFKVVQWFNKCRSRLGVSFGTVFYAANYLDRFISINQCNDWKDWTIELLSIACFSIASKFNETSSLSLHEIQMFEDLEYSFQSEAILRMELTLLKSLGWRLNSVTAYSALELLMCKIDSLKPHLHQKLISRVTELLLQATLDVKMLEFRQSILAVSALRCGLDQLSPPASDNHISYLTTLFNQSQKDDLIKCHKLMEAQTLMMSCENHYYCPSSPTTVLLKEQTGIYGDCYISTSVFKTLDQNMKLEPSRKRENGGY
ncbi:Cyclin [Quillaja saponaria]|uniref:B-like cyclin n=1 Tax=Quillaja saponaria TaxID=32244 RepID=A0AAD7LQZ3_QUISA|nr:Cyclin [Quillaja saponaria]